MLNAPVGINGLIILVIKTVTAIKLFCTNATNVARLSHGVLKSLSHATAEGNFLSAAVKKPETRRFGSYFLFWQVFHLYFGSFFYSHNFCASVIILFFILAQFNFFAVAVYIFSSFFNVVLYAVTVFNFSLF